MIIYIDWKPLTNLIGSRDISEKEYINNKELTVLKMVNFILKTKQLKNV